MFFPITARKLEVNKEMRFSLLGILFSLMAISCPVIAEISLPSPGSGNYANLCRDDWTKLGKLNLEMYNHCMQEQSNGYRELIILTDKYAQHKWTQDAVNNRIEQWTKKGFRNDLMVSATLQNDADGYEEFQLAMKKAGFVKSKFDACVEQWYPDLNMAWHCYKD